MAGPSCAGKTEVATGVAARLDAPVLTLDAYYRDLAHLPFAERAMMNFDTPEALESELLIEHLQQLVSGNAVRAPVYDFSQHVRAAETRLIRPASFIILEGLWALYWEQLRRLASLKVFVAAPDEICLARRIARDTRQRGRTAESVVEQYRRTVQPMARLYILPTMRYADLVLDGAGRLEDSIEAVLARIPARLP